MADRASASSALSDPVPFHPLVEDGLAGEQVVVVAQARRHVVEDHLDVVLPPVGQVRGGAAGTDEVVVHPQAGGLLEEPEDELALSEAEDHHRGGTEVHAVGGQPHQMRRHALELGQEHADPHRPRRELDAEELLGGEREHELVVER